MKTIVLLLLGVTIALAFPMEAERGDGWFMPKLDGSFEWVSVEEFEAIKTAAVNARATGAIKFYLFSSASSSQEIVLDNATSLKNSEFNKDYATRIIIHGWNNNYQSEVNTVLRASFLETGLYNVISVDWSSMAQTIIYASAAANVPYTGEIVASFIDFLCTSGGMSLANLFLMGHSLGAHVAGFAGKHVKEGTISQIYGLDPAAPSFSYDDPNGRLNTGDAAFVESIQTSCGLLGFMEPIGKAAFYPNGGISQPGCNADFLGTCSHGRSYKYFAEAIRLNNFPTMECGNYKDAVAKNCSASYSTVKMGAPSNYDRANGVYFVPVNGNSPYGKGNS